MGEERWIVVMCCSTAMGVPGRTQGTMFTPFVMCCSTAVGVLGRTQELCLLLL